MSTVGSVGSATTATTGDKSHLALNTEDFLKIMISELTNQDPFEPMKNQDLLNQMSAIQQINSSQSMATSFENLMGQFDTMILRQDINAAGNLVGQIVSGTNTAGNAAYGKVTAVNVDGADVMLSLDTGEQVRMQDVTRMGGRNSQDIIGQTVMTKLTGASKWTVGQVESVEIFEDQVKLSLSTDDLVPMGDVSILNIDNADLLMSRKLIATDGTEGTVIAISLKGDDQVELTIKTESDEEITLTMDEIAGIY